MKALVRKLVVTEFMSLDGVVENPLWSFPFWNDEISAFKQEETDRTDALVLGRRTYEEFAKAWPGRGAAEGGEFFNPVKKHVVSTTLKKDIWQNASFINTDVRKAIANLKAEKGKDLAVHGSITLARWLIDQGLVDELRLLVYPVVVGKGKRLFDGVAPAEFKLASARPLPKGVVALVYERSAEAGKPKGVPA